MEKKENAIIVNGKKYVYTKVKPGIYEDACDSCALVETCSAKSDYCSALGMEEDSEGCFQLILNGLRAEQLAWAMIVLLTGQLIGGLKYAEFYVLGGAALLYLLLSTLQYVWQSVTIWLVECRIKRTGVTLNDYPDWVGFGAWVFYWLKIIVIAIAAIYGASHFISFAM